MKVLVTGASGRIGRYVVRELVDSGHTVTGIDIAPGVVVGTPSLLVDLTDAGQVYQALAQSGAEAVVHMGAWADDGLVPSTRTYGDNVCGAFSVFQACADLGIQRVVSASSHQVYGTAHKAPLYVPIDENHPLRPQAPYALSKVVGEQAASYFVTRYEMQILSFRLLGIRLPSAIDAEIQRNLQDPGSRKSLMWTRCDVRDAALACRLAIEADTVAPGPYNITGQLNLLNVDSAALVSQYFPTTEIRDGLKGSLSPTSCAHAREAFGYRARFNWTVSQRYPE
jgi:nucleoside-diphosphate-sugar epimerase